MLTIASVREDWVKLQEGKGYTCRNDQATNRKNFETTTGKEIQSRARLKFVHVQLCICSMFVGLCVYVCVYIYICVCVCVSVKEATDTFFRFSYICFFCLSFCANSLLQGEPRCIALRVRSTVNRTSVAERLLGPVSCEPSTQFVKTIMQLANLAARTHARALL